MLYVVAVGCYSVLNNTICYCFVRDDVNNNFRRDRTCAVENGNREPQCKVGDHKTGAEESGEN